MGWIAGVDGCRGGWVAAMRNLATGEVTWERFATVSGLLTSPYAPAVVAIDMPIGLVETGARQCDADARRLMPGRASSIFPAPIRPILGAAGYWEANQMSRAISGKGLNRQSFGILPKIREVDAAIRQCSPGVLREAYPELAFVGLNGGRPLAFSKHRPEGVAERRALLSPLYGEGLSALQDRRRGSGVGVADLYDALAVLETARRIVLGTACRVPDPPPLDTTGLPMEIVFFR